MSWTDRHEEGLRRLGERTERKHDFTWRRPHTIQVSGKVPATLAVKTSALAGAASMTLKAVAGVGLRGAVWEDIVLVHDGTSYTLSADATAASDEIMVSFTPGLAGGASVDDVVTLPGTVDYTTRSDGGTLWGVRSDLTNFPIEPGSFGEQGFAFSIPRNGAPLTPRPGHVIKISTPIALEGKILTILKAPAPKWVVGVQAA